MKPFLICWVLILQMMQACGDKQAKTSQSMTFDHSGLPPLSATIIDDNEYYSGGDASVDIGNKDSFSKAPPPITNDFRLEANFSAGDHIFRNPHQNVGPLLNADNCQGCHLNDGRGKLPINSQQPMTSMVVKIGTLGGSPDPIYGDQIQPFAEQSFTTSDFQSGWPVYQGSLNGNALYGEAFAFVEFKTISGNYPDGSPYHLRKPSYYFKDLSFGDFDPNIQFSARLAPSVFGSGLLEAIPESNIRALADAEDRNTDGISGKASSVNNVVTGENQLGRFGYKAQSASVLGQIVKAYIKDIGLTTSFLPKENCTQAQLACLNAAEKEQASGDNLDFSNRQLALVEFYNRTLAVPTRRGFDKTNNEWQENIIQGRKHFFNLGCINCHVPRHVTGEAQGSILGKITLNGLEKNPDPIAPLSNQIIYPYTDLLLHDMGGSCQITRELQTGGTCDAGNECLYVQRCDGLADELIQGNASGREWKTPPLWGLGLVKKVNPAATFLHDGRARTIEEAILWHGGEAENVKQQFMQLSKTERLALFDFLNSL